MAIVSIVLVLVFSIILSIIEIPKMISNNLYKELWAFSILLFFGVLVALLKILNVPLSNPYEWITWVYSPILDLLKDFFE